MVDTSHACLWRDERASRSETVVRGIFLRDVGPGPVDADLLHIFAARHALRLRSPSWVQFMDSRGIESHFRSAGKPCQSNTNTASAPFYLLSGCNSASHTGAFLEKTSRLQIGIIVASPSGPLGYVKAF